MHQVRSDGHGVGQGSGRKHRGVSCRPNGLSADRQVQSPGIRPGSVAQSREDQVGPPSVRGWVPHRFTLVKSIPGFVAQLDVNGREDLGPRHCMAAGGSQCAAGSLNACGKELGQLPRFPCTHGRGGNDPGLGSHLLA